MKKNLVFIGQLTTGGMESRVRGGRAGWGGQNGAGGGRHQTDVLVRRRDVYRRVRFRAGALQ